MTGSTTSSALPRTGAWLALAAVAIAAVLAAYPSVRCGFVGGDDLRLLLEHPLVSQPSWTNAARLLVQPHRDLYQPLPMLAYMAEYRLFGHRPLGYHVDRLLLHAVNALLVWLLVQQLTGRRWVAALTGLAFGLHPLAIETIASVAKLTIPLSTGLILLCMIAYLRWRDRRRLAWYVLSLLTAAAAMLCKPIITLPLALLLLDLYRGWRPSRRWLVGWLPLAAMAAAALWLNLSLTGRAGLTGQASQQLSGPMAARIVLVNQWALTKYLWPAELAPWYPPPETVAWLQPAVIAGLASLLGCVVLAAATFRRAPDLGLGLALFIVYLLPYQGSVIARNLLSADRFMYLPIVGLHLAGVGAVLAIGQRLLSTLTRRRAILTQTAALACAAAVAAVWLTISWRTIRYYHNGLARARRVVALYPQHPNALAALTRVLDSILATGAPSDRPPVMPVRLASLLGDVLAGDDASAVAAADQLTANLPRPESDLAALRYTAIQITRIGQASPDRPALLWVGARLLLAQDRPAEARMLLEHLTDSFPDTHLAERAGQLLRQTPW